MDKLRDVIRRRSHRQITTTDSSDDGASVLSSQSIDSRLTQLPIALLSQLRVTTLARLPLETIAQLPPETLAKHPIETLAQLPVETIARLPIEKITRLPLTSIARLPTSTLSKLPLDVLEQLPPAILGDVPVDTLTDLPVHNISQLPPETIVKLPLKTLLELPGETYARLPPDALAKLDPSILALLLDKKPSIPRSHLLSKLSPTLLSSVVIENRRLLRYVRPESISQLDADVFVNLTLEQCCKFLPMALLENPPPELLGKLSESARHGLLSSLKTSAPLQRDKIATSPGAILAEIETLLMPYSKQMIERQETVQAKDRLAIEACEILAATNALMGSWDIANEHGRAAVNGFYETDGRGSQQVLGAIALMVRIGEMSGDDDDAECWREMLPEGQEVSSLLGAVGIDMLPVE